MFADWGCIRGMFTYSITLIFPIEATFAKTAVLALQRARQGLYKPMHAVWPYTRLGACLYPVQTVLGRLNACLLAVPVIYGCSVKLRV